MRILAFLLCFVLSVSNVSIVHATDTVSGGDATTTATFKRLGIDSTTKGNWEGNYGNDVAVLLGYNYLKDDNYNAANASKISIDRNRYNYEKEADGVTYYDTWSFYSLCNTGGNVLGYNKELTSVAELEVPDDASFEGATKKFESFHPGYYVNANDWSKHIVQNGSLQGLVGTDALAIPNTNRLTAYKYTMTDTAPHLFSIYGSGTMGNADIIVYFLSEDGSELLFKDTIAAGTFTSGAYVTYQVNGSFVMVTKIKSNEDGINGFFFDSLTDATSNLTVKGDAAGCAELTWTVAESVKAGTQIRVERKTGEENWTTVATVDTNSSTYTDETVTTGSTYTYRLTTVLGDLEVEGSSTVEYTVSGAGDSGDTEEIATAYYVGIDKATKGNWEGTYGSEAVVLFGYNYSGERNFTGTGGRFAFTYTDYSCDYVKKSTDISLASYSYVTEGKLWSYKADQTDTSVLNMPVGESLEKFNVYTSAGTQPYKNDTENVDKAAWKRATFAFEMSDDEYHQLSFYTNQTTTAPIYITILDKETNEVLLTDVYETTEFSGGAYVSYIVKGSCILHMHKTNNKDYVFGFSGFFVDPVNDNETSGLTAIAGDAARAIALSWTESEAISADAKLIIERKVGADGEWAELVAIDSGIKNYQDIGLQAGCTYYYRLRTKTGILNTLAGEAVQYTVPAYKNTALTFDKESYTAASASEQVTVKVALKDVDNVTHEGCSVSLQADYGHNVQEIPAVLTDSDGVASFTFFPGYLGNATLKATFSDNDEKQLMNTSAECAMFVGETQWINVPILWRVSDAVLPDDLISINGYGIKDENMDNVVIKYAPHTTDAVPVAPPEGAATLEKIQVDSRDGYYIVTRLPQDAAPGLYDIWVSNSKGYSNAVTLNAARPLFISEYEVWNGQNIEVSGRNFSARQFGTDMETKVRLNNGTNTYEQFLAKVTPYSIMFTVTDTPLGEYQVEVSNDSGNSWSGLDSDQILKVVEEGADPLEIGYAWMDHFAWNNQFDVTTYGGDGTDTADDTEAVRAAITAAKASSENGGIIYFPNGNYYISSLDILNNIVLLGESTEGTILIYNGTGENMFSNTDGIGHVGFAKFSVRLSDDAVRPDTFFWLGHPWDNSAKDVAYRTASEIFLKQINLIYPMTKETEMNRGLGVVAIGDERFSVQDCVFSGFAANFHNCKFNEYSGYYRIDLDYNQGYLATTASYSFVEDCSVIGGLRKSGQQDNHGVFGHQLVHMENNTVSGVGSVKNDGEPYAVEAPTGDINYGSVINATANTVSFIPEAGELQEHYAITHGRLAVRIIDGRGMGQQRDVASIDVNTNTLTLTEAWDIIPDSSCIISLIVPLDNITIYNNVQEDSAKGTYLYGNVYDAVVANNISVNTDGIYVHSSHVKSDRAIQSSYVSVRENILSGISPRTNDVKIAVQSTRRNNGSEYYAVGIYGVEIKNNQLEGIRGSVSYTTNSEAPSGNGLISWAGVKGDGNTDGYCGDNTNVIMENNIIKGVDTAITTTLGDYGFVLKGNHFNNVGTELSNTNTSGTENLLVMDSTSTRESLENFLTIWENVNEEEYTQESYEALQAAVVEARALLTQPSEPAVDDLAMALQELRIASSALRPIVKICAADDDGGETGGETGDETGRETGDEIGGETGDETGGEENNENGSNDDASEEVSHEQSSNTTDDVEVILAGSNVMTLNTGDNSNWGKMVGLLVSASIALAGILYFTRKKVA